MAVEHVGYLFTTIVMGKVGNCQWKSLYCYGFAAVCRFIVSFFVLRYRYTGCKNYTVVFCLSFVLLLQEYISPFCLLRTKLH